MFKHVEGNGVLLSLPPLHLLLRQTDWMGLLQSKRAHRLDETHQVTALRHNGFIEMVFRYYVSGEGPHLK